ncbi:MAG: hypothetical protein B6D39_12160 [Anaerolineae bacterium UTCFX2]|nr:MAG: hypothetical protein B6D39_12160 [Anaerolineae bacterium UTCFX2]
MTAMTPLPVVSPGSDKSLYNIGVVARMTGISLATLRAWERRYRFPDSERTAGGHRLYSEREILRLRWVKQRIGEGMQTAQAIQALKYQESTGQLILAEARPEPTEAQKLAIPAAHIHLYEERLVTALISQKFEEADAILGDALAASSPDDLILTLIAPAFAKIGQAWEAGTLNVAVEHLATNYLRQRLLLWMASAPPPKSIRPIVLACAPDEWHEGGLLILSALLRRRRFPVDYLGQAVPLPDLAAFVRESRPSLVVLTAMTENSALQMIEWPHWLPEAVQTGKPPIAYGGRIFALQPEWRLRMAGAYLGDDLRTGLDNLERILAQSS